ncbi:uncharacterized protein METZ01_LOCUS27671 [marine metagenome]|uniref:Uncharacterized protein n=1 Tax=marine metagenome TaxID=408172 RepID=A0A381Q9S6_9ZZZZ
MPLSRTGIWLLIFDVTDSTSKAPDHSNKDVFADHKPMSAPQEQMD